MGEGADLDLPGVEESTRTAIAQLAVSESERQAVCKLQLLHEDHKALEKQYHKELRALQDKYQKQYNPLYADRLKILSEPAADVPLDQGCHVRNFWLTVLLNNDITRHMICEPDKQVLAYLRNIQAAETFTPGVGDVGCTNHKLRLSFIFAENPFFDPLELDKTFIFENDDRSDPVLIRTEVTEIQWKPGKDLTRKTVTRKQKNKRTKQIRKLTETIKVESFFNFFHAYDPPDEEEVNKMKEEEVAELETVMESEYEAAMAFKERIIPHAVAWFTGEDKDSGDDDMSDDDEDELDEEDTDDEDDPRRR